MTVYAAGAVIWRQQPKGIEVLLVERTKHRDMTIPKGKLDPGETLPECAVREMLEETGIAVHLGAHLGTSEYRLPEGRQKIVHYWTAEASTRAIAESRFAPNGEIKALHWLPLQKAMKACTYEHDTQLLERFDQRRVAGELLTTAIVALRHAKASSPDFETPDAARELTDRGRKQAVGVAPGLAAFGITRVRTSSATRCQQTVAPLAKLLRSEPKTTKRLSMQGGGTRVRELVERAIEKGTSTVLCSHAPVLPEVVAGVVERTGAEVTDGIRRSASLSTAAFSVFHVTTGPKPRLVSFETHRAPL